MPLPAIASAICLIKSSLTLQANLFQLFQPIGGVLARPLSRARNSPGGRQAMNKMQKKEDRRRRVFVLVIREFLRQCWCPPGKMIRRHLRAHLVSDVNL